MKRYALLGEKLGHSYSKLIHEFIFTSLKTDATYELRECTLEDLPLLIKELKKGTYAGFNVTIPYKKAIMEYLDKLDVKAREIGSVNTVYLKDGKVIGTNTDYDGFLAMIEKYQVEVFQKNCYILGTGGASLAVGKVLKDLGGQVYFVSRTPKENQLGYSDLSKKELDIVINTTPVGMYPNVSACPLEDDVIKNTKVVMDIIFNPNPTLLLKKAHSSMNGLWMLLMQAVKAEEIWQNRKISVDFSLLLEKLEELI